MHSIFTIYKKEMTDLLRDRRTLIAMIILPLVLIPLILVLTGRFSKSGDDVKGQGDLRVAVVTNDNGGELMDRLKRRKDLKVLEGISPYEFKTLIRNDSIDYGLIIDKDFDAQIQNGKTGSIELFHESSSRDSSGYERVAKTITSYRRDIVDQRLEALGTNTSILKPTSLKTTNVKIKKNSIASFAGGILPVFFVMFCFIGAMYPAIDLFTGEKERGTIETLLVLPVNRFQILIGKLLVIASAGAISGLLNFLGIYLVLKFNNDLPFVSVLLNGKSVLLIGLMMIPLSTFFAGLLIPISIYAKSFKEAQSLIQPLLIVILVPVIVGMSPSFELNIKTALIPIMNVTLACKSIVGGTYEWGLIGLVFLSLFILSGLGIVLSKKGFSDEKNIFRM